MNYLKQLVIAELYPGDGAENALDLNNAISVFLFAVLPGLSPNGNSIILTISMVWAIYCLARGRFPFNLSKSDRLVAICMSIYPLVMIAGIFANPQSFQGLGWIIRLLPFFSIWVLLPRMRLSPDGRLVPLFILGAGIGMIATLLLSLWQLKFGFDRAEGGATNAALLGIISVLFGGVALLNIQSSNKIEQMIAILGYVSGLGCALLSGTRAAWLVIPVHLLIFLWYFRRRSFHFSVRRSVAVGLFLLLGLLALSSVQILDRVRTFQENLASLEDTEGDVTSLSARVALYKGALSAIAKDPFTGYGPQNRMDSVLAEVPESVRQQLGFTHVHNGFLTAGIDAGIWGMAALLVMLVAPVIGAWKKEPGPGRDMALALALILTSSYMITGSFGIMFGQKALDPIFAFTVALICADRGSTSFSSALGRQKAKA